jgi:elongator complex protein 3
MDPKIVIKELIKYNPKTKNDIEIFKHKLCKQYKLNVIYNSELLSFYQILIKNQTIKPNQQLEKLLIGKNSRSLSGVSVITISSKPYPCPGNCLYCPTQKSVPKSYLNNEPAILRAIRHNYDPSSQVKERLKVLNLNGHPTDKLEIIVIGGTFSFFNKQYQTQFIKKVFDACNIKPSKTLELSQKLNEKSKNRIIGLTIETRPDFINNQEIKHLRKLGVTRVELGVQSIFDDILKLNNRGHLIQRTIDATKLLKDSGFKICYHMMPNLYGSNPKKDLQMFKELFSNQAFQPDMLKIYPCMIIKEADLYKVYQKGLYKPYNYKTLSKLLKDILLILPPYVRVQRLIRDIPSQSIVEGVKISNLREIIEKELTKEKKKV